MLRNHVLLKIDPDPECGIDADRDSPIIAPEAHRWNSRRAEVLAVGPGTHRKRGFAETTVRKGDRVSFAPTAGQILDIGGVEHRIVTEDDIELIWT